MGKFFDVKPKLILMKTMFRIYAIAGLLLFPMTVLAQDRRIFVADGIGNFFVAIISGILLAFAFQFLLTNLAVAIGITSIGDISEKGNKSSSSDKSSDMNITGPKISAGLGIFLLITLSISVFFASLVAVNLSMVASNVVGMTLGLVIWAGYFLLGIYIDSKIISSLTGLIFSTVKNTLTAGAATIGYIFTPSPKSLVKDTARESIKAIHDEIVQEYDISGFREKLDEYLEKLAPQRIDMDNIHDHISSLIHELKVKELYTPEDAESARSYFFELAEKQPRFSPNDKQKVKNAFQQAIEIFKREGSVSDKVLAAVDKLTPGDEKQGREYRQKIEQYLRDTKMPELNPDNLKNDWDRILNNPKAAPEIIRTRVSMIDRNTIKAVLSKRQGMTEEKAEAYIQRAEEFLNSLKTRAADVREQGEGKVSDLRSIDVGGAIKERRAKMEEAIYHWFNRMDRTELNYTKLKRDVQRMLDDPKAAPAILRNRLRLLDRDSLVALLSNNDWISQEQADDMISRIEEARDTVIRKTEQIENRITTRVEEMKKEALNQAEAARKTAEAAAWWVFIAAVVSGAASALGGILAS
jgi:hypothetical protein